MEEDRNDWIFKQVQTRIKKKKTKIITITPIDSSSDWFYRAWKSVVEG